MPLARALPARPAYAVPVAVPEPVEDDDARLVAARERAGRIENARRLTAFGTWFDAVRSDYAGTR